MLAKFMRKFGPDSPLPPHMIDFLNSKPPAKLSAVLLSKLRQLASFERYERRALSRRKFAIREFDVARRCKKPA